MSPQEEAKMAADAFQSLKQKSRVSTDSSMNAAVQRVGGRIAKVVPEPAANWEFVVFEDASPNAFALPGGKIGVHTGLFKVATNDELLATVIAHEIAHVTARHGAERASQGTLVQLGGAALGAGLGSGSGMSPAATQTILGAYGAGSRIGVVLPHSRLQESEADELGLIYMARAGYDPLAAVRFWQGMMDYGKASRSGGQVPAFLRTHPVDDQRIARLQSLMPRALDEYRLATGEGVPASRTSGAGLAEPVRGILVRP